MTLSMPLPGRNNPHVKMVGLLGRFARGRFGNVAPCGIVVTFRRSTA